MPSILNIAVGGLNNAIAQSVKAASTIVKASSTQNNTNNSNNNIDGALVALKTSEVNYDANAVVIKATKKTEQALLDIIT